MRSWRWLIVACAWALCSTLCLPVHALDLSWSAPAGCLSQAELEQRVAALHARHGRTDPGGAAKASIQRENSGEYVLTLKVLVRGQSLSRVVRSRDCLSACETAAWLLAMVGENDEAGVPANPPARVVPAAAHSRGSARVDSSATAARPAATAEAVSAAAPAAQASEPAKADEKPPSETPPAEKPPADKPPADKPPADKPPAEEPAEPEPPAPEPDSAPSEGEPTTQASSPSWGRLALFVGLWGNDLPAPAALVGARAGIGRGIFYGEVRASFVLPREEQLADTGSVRVYTQQLGLSGCAQWGSRLRLGPCLRLTGQHSLATTTAGVGARQDDIFWLTAGPSALLGTMLYQALELSFEAGIELPLSPRPRFSVQGEGPVASAAFVSGYAQIGLGLRWQ